MTGMMRTQKTVQEFKEASYADAGRFDPQRYQDRTCRNHFWIGGAQGQEELRKLRVGVAGLGGMGANIANHLVRLGIGHLRIADPDTIEATNLNRQVIARRESLGSGKVETAIRDLRGIAEDFDLIAYDQGITESMVEEFVDGCDAIVDEVDVYQLETHVTLHRAARARGLPLYSTYAVGFGIHFYKFHGEDFTFEDFLGGNPNQWAKPSPEFLLERIGKPYPTYIDAERGNAFADEIRSGSTPIFGPATLLGQALVTMRMVLDLLSARGIPFHALGGQVPTPVMPEFVVLDPADLTLKTVRAPD